MLLIEGLTWIVDEHMCQFNGYINQDDDDDDDDDNNKAHFLAARYMSVTFYDKSRPGSLGCSCDVGKLQCCR